MRSKLTQNVNGSQFFADIYMLCTIISLSCGFQHIIKEDIAFAKKYGKFVG